MLYRLKCKFSRLEGNRRVRYKPGDTFHPTPEEVEKLGPQRLEPVAEPKAAPAPSTPEVKAEAPTPTLELLEARGGGWYRLPNGDMVQGKYKALERLGRLLRAGEEK